MDSIYDENVRYCDVAYFKLDSLTTKDSPPGKLSIVNQENMFTTTTSYNSHVCLSDLWVDIR